MELSKFPVEETKIHINFEIGKSSCILGAARVYTLAYLWVFYILMLMSCLVTNLENECQP